MPTSFDAYSGTEDYISSEALASSVNAAIALERPLLIKGEPGTGKTLLAHSIAKGLGKQLLTWNVKSTTKAQDGLYHYDVVQRLNDSRFGDGSVADIERYIKLGILGQAFESTEQVVVLIDEVDKADLEFPNDLLHELDRMTFHIHELDREVKAVHRPIIIITSNAEKELPDAFLRRCIFHYIEFPDEALMDRIVRVHYPDLSDALLEQVKVRFYFLRGIDALRKKPSTSELIDWIHVLLRSGITPDEVRDAVPYIGTLIKKEGDLDTLRAQRYIGPAVAGPPVGGF